MICESGLPSKPAPNQAARWLNRSGDDWYEESTSYAVYHVKPNSVKKTFFK
jgi:hypothetical protein